MKQLVNEKCEDCRDKTEYIPDWQDDNLIFPVEFSQNQFIQREELINKFVVQYSGNMGLWNELKTIGKAVKRNIENVMFIFIGGGLRKVELLKEFSVGEQQNVIMMPFQPNEKFNDILTASHVQLVTLRDGLEGIAVPCKIYGILAAGLPVIAMVPEDSEIAYIVKEENCGFVINPNDPDALINIICLLKSDDNLRKKMGINSRHAFEEKYTTKINAEKYIRILCQLSE